jgi:predicted dehydrogenase
MDRIRVGVIGCGYWGPNLIRNFSACPLTEVAAVLDRAPERLQPVQRLYSHVRCVTALDEFLETGLDAVAIATPVSTHFPLAKRCLESGLHVLVEKPLAATAEECRTLDGIAKRAGRVLMVDHTFVYSNSVRRIKELVENDELGELYYIDSVRINLGLFQHDVNVIWDLAPHDLSIVDFLLGSDPRSISALGCSHTPSGNEDVAYVNVDYSERMLASFHVSWLSPVKVRQMIVAGARKSLIFSELNTTEPIKVYDRAVAFSDSPDERREVLVSYRTGDVWSPHIQPVEPLQQMVTHFAECIQGGSTPLTDGRAGERVVKLLEAATRSMRAQGGRVVLTNGTYGNGNGHERSRRNGELHPDRPGRAAGSAGDRSLLREPVRLPDR